MNQKTFTEAGAGFSLVLLLFVFANGSFPEEKGKRQQRL